MNPLQPLYDQCNSGTNAEKFRNLPEFPRIIDVELTSACNFRCLMCPTGNLSLKRKTGFMTRDTFDTLVSDCAPHQIALRFIGWGEPTMHPELSVFVKTAHDAGLLTHLNTNGSIFGPKQMSDLIDAGLDSIKFSFQGVEKESFRTMRNVDFFDALLHVIRKFVEIRGKKTHPFIAVSTTTTNETSAVIEQFRRDMVTLVDQVSIGKTVFDHLDMDAVRLNKDDQITLWEQSTHQDPEPSHPKPCPEVFDKLSIHYDGSVVVCCNDHNGETDMGNINAAPIDLIWSDKNIEDYRAKLVKDDYTSPNCKTCYDYLDLGNG